MTSTAPELSAPPRRRHRLRFLILSIIILAYIFMVLRLQPANFFGLMQDDSIYFSSAKAIAAGQGYILPSLPGTPRATKYPILLPWLQSWIWRLDADFPRNMKYAVALNLAFGVLFILLAHSFLCRLDSLLDWEVLVLVFFCALHPTFVFYSVNVMSDVPFAALILAAVLLAERARRNKTAGSLCLLTGLVACLAVLMRLAGLPIAAGIALALFLRHSWQGVALFAAGFCPAILILANSWFAEPSPAPHPFSSSLPGWTQTWLYYTSYRGFRGLEGHSFTLLFNQALYFLFGIPDYFLAPLSHHNIVFWLLSAGLALGLTLFALRSVDFFRVFGSLGFALALYVLTLLLWDYPAWDRFLLPFLPFLAAVMWLGIRNSAEALRRTFNDRRQSDSGTLITCIGLGIALVIFVAAIAWNFAITGREAAILLSNKRGAALNDRFEAYAWLNEHSAVNSRIIASEDAYLFLATGRQSLTFTTIPAADVYDRKRLLSDLDHLTDPARAVNAAYWLTFDDEAEREVIAVRPALISRMREWESKLPLVFRSSHGIVRIYGLACLDAEEAACQPSPVTN
jgi:MFS family permease